jgi:hypothetical protein
MAQKRYAGKNKELLREKDTRQNHHNPERDAENRNQRNSDLGWKWMHWSELFRKRLVFNYKELSLLNERELDNPEFIFIYGGKRTCENLRSPLPC